MTKRSPTRVLIGRHRLLLGKTNGVFVCVCLECGVLLGAAKRLPILMTLDRLHSCVTTFFARSGLGA